MKRSCAALISIFVLGCAASAGAEHRLSPTAVAGFGEVEAQARFKYYHQEYDYSYPDSSTVNSTTNSFGSSYSLGFGLGGGFQLDARIPYSFHNVTKQEPANFSAPAQYSSSSGWGDPTFGIKYRLSDALTKPYEIAVRVDVKPEKASRKHGGTRTNNIRLGVVGSREWGSLKPYAGYSYVYRDRDASSYHMLDLGCEQILTPRVTLVPEISGEFLTGSHSVSSYQSYSISLSSYLQVWRNLYLLPGISGVLSSTATSRTGGVHFNNGTAVEGTIGVYYLFQ